MCSTDAAEGAADDQPKVLSTDAVQLVRFFFDLPEPVAFPDGFGHAEPVGDQTETPRAPGEPLVSLIFHQVSSEYGRIRGGFDAVNQVTSRVEGLPPRPDRPKENAEIPGLEISYTVVEAVTTVPSQRSSATQTLGRDLKPSEDALARCFRLVADLVRAYRHATEIPLGTPAYERMPQMVIAFEAAGESTVLLHDEDPLIVVRPVEEWSNGHIVKLDHWNLADPLAGPDFSEDIHQRLASVLYEMRRGNPLLGPRERLIEARRLLAVLGEYGQAVTLANTSCEVLLDTTLALLLWEDQTPLDDAIALFEQGKVLQRITKQLAPRLKGNWATTHGPVGEWMSSAYRLRHRVVHGGLQPTAKQANDAVAACQSLQTFVMNRIAARRTAYPRSALMTVSEEGLRRRNLWSGQIVRFVNTVAPTEPDWRDSFVQYHHAIIESGSPS